jgi:ribosomal protein S18 acetylase RimI-like enzyme
VNGHVLDNPVWHALTTRHAGLAINADGAAKYPPAVAPFGAVESATPRAADQLTSLLTGAESIYLVGVAPPEPHGWVLKRGKPMLQMICQARIPVVEGPAITPMTAAHCDDMLALTALVFPGFFRARTLEMGDYIGIYDGARLVAMAGERMRLDGYQEMSAVCTHPDCTGRGYAQRLLALLCNAAFDRGFTPFLHVYSDNTRAIAVYRKLGFVERSSPPLWSLQKAAGH